jgi:hypothetical protein
VIDLHDRDVHARLDAADGRFVLLLRPDAGAVTPLPWWGVVLDIRGDGHGILARLDERAAAGGWTAIDLLDTALGLAEGRRAALGSPLADEVARLLRLAIADETRRRGPLPRAGHLLEHRDPAAPGVTLLPSGMALPLCADDDPQAPGATLEQLLLLLARLFGDASACLPAPQPRLARCAAFLDAALAAERRRLSTPPRNQGA